MGTSPLRVYASANIDKRVIYTHIWISKHSEHFQTSLNVHSFAKV